jgi:hypothetical protein
MKDWASRLPHFLKSYRAAYAVDIAALDIADLTKVLSP